jgi:hypothetical protein
MQEKKFNHEGARRRITEIWTTNLANHTKEEDNHEAHEGHKGKKEEFNHEGE